VNKGKKRAANEFIIKEPSIEYVDVNEDNTQDNTTSALKGTTDANFIKFINGLLDVMNFDKNLKWMNNCTIHKSKLMIRKVENHGYKVMYLPPYSPKLNPIEQFWAVIKEILKRHRLLTQKKSERITET
jgi:transposase